VHSSMVTIRRLSRYQVVQGRTDRFEGSGGFHPEVVRGRGVRPSGLLQALPYLHTGQSGVARRDDRAVAYPAVRKPGCLEFAVGPRHRVRGEPQVGGELPDRRQLGPGREHSAGDHRGDLAADLLVRRGRAVRVNLDDHLPSHVADPAVAGTAAGRCHGAVATNQPSAAAAKTASVDMTPMTFATAESSGWAATVCTEMQKKTSASPPPESTCRARERMASSAAITSGS